MEKFNIIRSNSATKSAVAHLCNKEALPNIPSKAFEGEYLQTAMYVSEEGANLYVGVGDLAEITPLELKEIGAKIAKAFKAEKIFDFAIENGSLEPNDDYFRNIPQGIILGVYEYSLKSEQKPSDNWNVELLGGNGESDKALAEGISLAEATVYARDFINAPANHLRPADYAGKISDLLTPLGVEVKITAGKDLEKMGMGGLYGIGSSSEFPPQLVVMRYNGAGGGHKTALVGKGITYDTGGYSLKPSGSMASMEGDMAGSAAVVAAIYAIAKNKIKTDVVGIAVLAENRLSNSALVPGDVYTAYDGQTVEVLNTDAEGRLVLADGVAYAVKDEKADQVVDVATLTGAVVRSLGFGVAGTVTNDNATWNEVEAAAKLSGERYWNFPTYKEYHKMIESKIADVKNIGKPEGGTITAGLFIGKFVQDKPWIHLDIAGTSWMDTPLFEHQISGGEGTSVDTLYYFCKNKVK